MARKKSRQGTKQGKKALSKSHPGPLERLRNAQTGGQAREGMLEAILTNKESRLFQVGIELADVAAKWPAEITRLTDRMSECGLGLALLAGDSNDTQKSFAKYVMLYRQRLIKELEVNTAAELMLLDAAMDAYAQYMYLSALVRACFKEGTNSGEKSRLQGRITVMAQSYLKVFTDSMKALNELKRPPIRILQVRAGENVAIQINEKTRVLEAHRVGLLPQEDQRRMLPESTPAGSESAAEDSV